MYLNAQSLPEKTITERFPYACACMRLLCYGYMGAVSGAVMASLRERHLRSLVQS